MDIILLSMLPLLVPLAFVLYYALHRVKCPDCGDTLLFMFYSPFKKTRRLSRASCYLCARCGCETNAAGQKVTVDTPSASFLTLQWASLAFLLLVAVGVGVVAASLILSGPATVAAAPLVVAAPVVVELPQQAPAVPPVK
jgi:hypothetical protein